MVLHWKFRVRVVAEHSGPYNAPCEVMLGKHEINLYKQSVRRKSRDLFTFLYLKVVTVDDARSF